MKRIVKYGVWLLASIAVFGLAAWLEAYLRQMQEVGMHISGTPIADVDISGTHKPDFLWLGRAWRIEMNTQQPLILTLDHWQGEIPPGKHTIYANHDSTNTGQYNEKSFGGFPASVAVRVNTD